MATVVDDALHADEADTGDAEVAHQFFRVHLAKVRVFHHFVVLGCILERQVVLWQLLSLEWLLQVGLAEWAESESLLLNLDEAHFAESVAAVQISRHSRLPVEVLVTRRALHLSINQSNLSDSTFILLLNLNQQLNVQIYRNFCVL